MNKRKVITIRVDSYTDRQSIISGLANSGYKVWVEEKLLNSFPLTETYFVVCFEVNP